MWGGGVVKHEIKMSRCFSGPVVGGFVRRRCRLRLCLLRRESVGQTLPDGTVRKMAGFRHKGLVVPDGAEKADAG